ncbi:hypothetical protein GIB67_039665 [Kingdonia uniflora]|uniref:Uncharacterized protein n=1 Tax=Kingdonia uniflora TaxID=39325 RepID=A0A7J7LSJ3_9MAGN|nr:hypothetical protein GIB67_039665 [Kingdonia uniflora]
MEIYSPIIAKRLWNFLKVYFMMRKGLNSKRRFVIDVNSLMKKSNLLMKTIKICMPRRHSRNVIHGGFGLQQYDFSCSNSPPGFFHVANHKHRYFPCINSQDDHEEVGESSAVIPLPKNFQSSPEYLQEFQFGMPNLAPGEKLSQPVSSFSVRVSNYSSEDENVSGNRQVDDNAKEFIRMFYEQLRLQNRTQLIQYQGIC